MPDASVPDQGPKLFNRLMTGQTAIDQMTGPPLNLSDNEAISRLARLADRARSESEPDVRRANAFEGRQGSRRARPLSRSTTRRSSRAWRKKRSTWAARRLTTSRSTKKASGCCSCWPACRA